MREIPILFENSHCLVLNKPSGFPVQGGKGIKISLDSFLTEKIHPRPFLIHRLDRDTSGIILVAKTKEAARDFSALVDSRRASNEQKIVKRYQGVCSGIFENEEGAIRLSLDLRAKGHSMIRKEAETFFRVISTVRRPDGSGEGISCSLLELELGTGRMHQIRRHLASLGHPLLGDDKYGNFSLNKNLKKALGLKHLLLHASRLIIPPLSRLPDGLDICAELPSYFSSFLETSR